MKKINLGFVLTFNKNSWLGGSIYLSNLINQITNRSSNINPIIFTNLNISKKDLSDFKKIKIVKSSLFSQSLINRIVNKIQISLFGKNFFLEKFLVENKIDVMSHFFVTGRKSKIKSLFWIPDFQEIHDLNYISFKKKILRKINLIYAIKIHLI